MRKHRPSDAQIARMLNAPHFAPGQQNTDPARDPISPTLMVVDIDRIEPYDHNPRRTPNAEYQRIKESIRSAGMDQALTITRRPGDEHYMVAAGGNTRLQAIKELRRESGDEALERIHCLYRPWSGDTDAIIAHLKENDVRGDLCFIERAQALRDLRYRIEDELNAAPSKRQLVEELARRGYSISRALLFWCDYAVDVLHPAIPNAFASGMGRHQVQALHNLERAFTTAWRALRLGDADAAHSVFAEVLARHDAEAIDQAGVRRDLEAELSVTADCDLQRASLVMGTALDGRPIPASLSDTDASGPESTGDDHSATEAPPRPERDRAWGESTPVTPKTPRASPTTHSDEHGAATHNELAAPQVDTTSLTVGDDAPALRARARELATRLANKARMGDVVIPISRGMGYLVATVPAELGAANPPEVRRTMAIVWWQLVSVAEQFAAHRRAYAHIPPEWQGTSLATAMRAAGDRRGMFVDWQWRQADNTTFEQIPPLNGPDLGPRAYLVWSERDWSDWVALVSTYRAIHRLTDGDPWETRSWPIGNTT